MPVDVAPTIAAIWRIEAPAIIATVARITGDVGRAEDFAQDAFVAALAQWPDEGIPRNPGAWLTTAAKRRAIDAVRRERVLDRKTATLEVSAECAAEDEALESSTSDIDDDMLRLMFVACHPMLAAPARVALTLRVLGGLTTPEIARAYLVPEPTIAQRIVRAKRMLADARVPFEVPAGEEREVRLRSVLESIYLIFNEGYAATSGDDVLRPELIQDALRLGRVLSGLVPREAEVHGLVALMEIQSSRMRARVAPDGAPILLLDQDRGAWDHLAIGRGLTALARAESLAPQRGTYTVQAGIAACHARAGKADATDWTRIADLYGELAALARSPVVELNRAVAVGMADGPAAGLVLVDALRETAALRDYHLLPSVRADLLHKLGRSAEARVEFERAASLAQNSRDRTLLLNRAQACGDSEAS